MTEHRDVWDLMAELAEAIEAAKKLAAEKREADRRQFEDRPTTGDAD